MYRIDAVYRIYTEHAYPGYKGFWIRVPSRCINCHYWCVAIYPTYMKVVLCPNCNEYSLISVDAYITGKHPILPM